MFKRGMIGSWVVTLLIYWAAWVTLLNGDTGISILLAEAGIVFIACSWTLTLYYLMYDALHSTSKQEPRDI